MAKIPYTMRILRDALIKERADLEMWNRVNSRPAPEELSEFDYKVPGMVDKYDNAVRGWEASQQQSSKSISSGTVRIEDLQVSIAILKTNL